MFEEENTTTIPEEYDEILPDGWQEDSDIFDESTWGDSNETADEPEQEESTVFEDGMAEEEENAPTPEQEENPGDVGEAEAPTTEPETTPNNKLKFKARVDRQDLDVELDESDLPTIYQKAQATDRAQAKLAKQENLAKSLGYESLDAMLTSLQKNQQDSEVDRLVGEGVHEEVARDIVSRRNGQVPAPTRTEETATPSPARDFQGEVRELLGARPDLKGKSLPDEVIKACTSEGKNLFVAYAEYEARQEKAAAEKLRKENEILKQNAASAAKAPVSGTKGGGATNTKAEDDFLRGFNFDY